MRKIKIPCRTCGEEMTLDPRRLADDCPFCGEPLLLNAAQVRELLGDPPPKPGKEPIPTLSTEGAEEKTKWGYTLEAIRWAAIVLAFIGILSLVYGQLGAMQ